MTSISITYNNCSLKKNEEGEGEGKRAAEQSNSLK